MAPAHDQTALFKMATEISWIWRVDPNLVDIVPAVPNRAVLSTAAVLVTELDTILLKYFWLNTLDVLYRHRVTEAEHKSECVPRKDT